MLTALKKFYEDVVHQPEAVRRRFAIFFIALAVPPIIGLWFYSFKLSLREVTGEEKEKPKASSEIVSEFHKGVANIKEILGEVDVGLPFRAARFKPVVREVLPRTYLPLEP